MQFKFLLLSFFYIFFHSFHAQQILIGINTEEKTAQIPLKSVLSILEFKSLTTKETLYPLPLKYIDSFFPIGNGGMNFFGLYIVENNSIITILFNNEDFLSYKYYRVRNSQNADEYAQQLLNAIEQKTVKFTRLHNNIDNCTIKNKMGNETLNQFTILNQLLESNENLFLQEKSEYSNNFKNQEEKYSI